MKMHLNLHVRDLDRSVAFYRVLFQADPIKHFGDYALFITDKPGLELALDLAPETAQKHDAHFGIVVDNEADVDAQIARLTEAGFSLDIEREETCCYAVQTKVWATDPDGRRWETYYVLDDVEERDEPVGCCAPDDAVKPAVACCN